MNAFECNAFIDSLVKSVKDNMGDVNRVIPCDGCGEEDTTVYCVDCQENFGPTCLVPHRRGKLSASHQQIPLDEAMACDTAIKRIPRCQKHVGYEVDSYCKTCTEAICSKCGIEKHSGHTFCPLIQVTGPLQDQIAGYAITMGRRQEEATKAITTLDGTIIKIEENRCSAEKEIAEVFDVVAAYLEERRVRVLQEMHTTGDQLRKTAIQGKGEAESATVEFREFHSFAKGLLAQGTPLEIAGTHKMVREFDLTFLADVVTNLSTFGLFLFLQLNQVQARNATLENHRFLTQVPVSPGFKFSSGNLEEVKKAISTLGSIVDK